MACEACASKFSLFKRKKQCMDCLRYFCTECVIRRFDRILSCDNCSMLSRRPLIRSQVLQMRSKYLRQYLLAKKVSIKGCIEKEDLVNLVIIFANGDVRSNDRLENTPPNQVTVNNGESDERQSSNQEPTEAPDILETTPTQHQPMNEGLENSEAAVTLENIQYSVQEPSHSEASEIRSNSPIRRSRSPQATERSPDDIPPTDDALSAPDNPLEHNVVIEELSEHDDINSGPEPVITEHEEVEEETPTVENTPIFTEIRTWTGSVKLCEIKELAELESLSVKQLKDLLCANRVDYKGCVERCELFARALRLWEEYQKSRKIVETADEDALCKICLDAPIECVILECGHMACCINCGKQMAECPICRQYVVRVVRFFKA